MAANASGDRVRADIRPPDFRGAVVKIRGLKKKKEKIASINGEIGDEWAKIEGLKVNKLAGRMFAKLDALEGPDRADVLRSLNGLIDAAGWPKEEQDLVDGAQGNVVQMRVGATEKQEEGDQFDEDERGEEEDGDGDEEPAPTRSARRGPIANLDEARRHLGGKSGKGAGPAAA